MEAFKKGGEDYKSIIKEIQKSNKAERKANAEVQEEDDEPTITLSPDKADKLLRLMGKLRSKKLPNE
jgi:hypothetical protein